jgi:hypothetical protein
MRYAAVVLLALLATSAFAQSDDFTFFPYSTGPSGGDEITITARGSVRFFAPLVFFGDVKSPHVTLVDATHIKAIAPAHAIGAVPLTVRDFGVDTLRTNLSFGYTHDLESILIPIALQPTGASQGTRWMSEIVVYNDSDVSVPIDPEVCFFIGAPFDCGQPARRVPPHSSLRVEPGSANADYPDMFLAPPVDQAGSLSYSVRLYEMSRDPDGAGTEIPVIRWNHLQATKIWLPSVTTSVRFRTTIRIYTSGGGVVLSVRDAVTGDVLAQREKLLNFPTDAPRFAVVTWNDILSSPEVRAHDRVRIEVQSAGAGWDLGQVWALLTLTDNDTQRVQIFTPQSASSSTSSSTAASLPRPPG